MCRTLPKSWGKTRLLNSCIARRWDWKVIFIRHLKSSVFRSAQSNINGTRRISRQKRPSRSVTRNFRYDFYEGLYYVHSIFEKNCKSDSVTSNLMSLEMHFVSSLTTFVITMADSSWFPLNAMNAFFFSMTLSCCKIESCFDICNHVLLNFDNLEKI